VRRRRRSLACSTIALMLGLAVAAPAFAETHELRVGAFVVEHELVLPGAPEAIYDALTGDVSGWWDHSFSGAPQRLYIEAKPGGGFYEIFDKSGDGAKHAEVITAQRGKLLRFVGPLGLSGKALQMVHTYTLEPAPGDSTRLKLSVHAAGEIEDGWADLVDRVWYHFLFERFKPWVEAGQHQERARRKSR
jgi:hypothetical protein